MRNLDLDLLRSLVAIAQNETFSSAADKLHKTQSAVTQQMQRLEALTGVALFEKSGRNKRLSVQGEKLVKYARHMLTINDEALQSLVDAELVGHLRLGAPLDVAESLLPTVLTQVARSSPHVQMEIRVDRSPHLMTAMHHGELDLIISTRSDPAFDGVVLRTSPTVWLCSADYVHDARAPVPLIMADEPSIFRRFALAALEQTRLSWHINYLAPNLVGIRAALRAGLGVTARSVEQLGPDLRVLGAKDGLPPLPDVHYFLLVRRDLVSPLARQIYDMLTTHLGLTQE